MEAVAVIILAPFLVLLLISWLYDLVWRAWLGISSTIRANRIDKLYQKYLDEGMSWPEASVRATNEVDRKKKAPRKRG